MKMSAIILISTLIVIISSVYLFKVKNSNSNHKSNELDNSVNTSTRNIVERMESTKKRVIIFFGSQTGTAEEYATRIAKG